MDRNKSVSNLMDFIKNPDILILINRLDPNQHRVVNYKTGEVVEVVRSTLAKFVKGCGDEIQNQLREKDCPALFEFNPYDSRVVWQESDGTTHYNQFQLPKHARIERDVKQSPAVFDDFLTFLFDSNDAAKSHMLDVLATMLIRRVETIPCLVGAGGIGKNTLVEQFLPLLVGKANHTMARQHDIKSNFNSWSENKQVIVYDEVKLTDELTVNAIKSRTNETIVVEAKGLDRRQVPNFATSFILSNDASALGNLLDNRRTSVYPLTETPLKDANELLSKYGGSITAFRSALLNSETVADVYWFLKARTPPLTLPNFVDEGKYSELKASSSSSIEQDLIHAVEAYLQGGQTTTIGEIIDNGWTELTSNRTIEVLRAASNRHGKIFKLGSGKSRDTTVQLKATQSSSK